MRSLLHDLTVLHKVDLIGHSRRRQSVRDEDDTLALRQLHHVAVHVVLGKRVERRRWLIEDYHVRLRGKNSRDGDLLRLSAGRNKTLLVELAAYYCIESLGKASVPAVELCVLECFSYFRVVFLALGSSHENVLRKCHREHLKVLEDRAESVAVHIEVDLVDVDAVHKDLTLRHGVEPHEKLDERRLAGTVVAYDGYLLALTPLEADAVNGRRIRTGVCESHVLKLNRFDLVKHDLLFLRLSVLLKELFQVLEKLRLVNDIDSVLYCRFKLVCGERHCGDHGDITRDVSDVAVLNAEHYIEICDYACEDRITSLHDERIEGGLHSVSE